MNDIKNNKKNLNKDMYNKKVENYEIELLNCIEEYKIKFPLSLKKKIEKFFNYDNDLINDYNNNKKEYKKKITTLKYNIKYNKNAEIRLKKTDVKNVKIDYVENVLNEKIDEIIELKNIINDKDKIIDNKDKIIDNKDKDIFEQKKIIKEDKKTIFNLNMVIKDLKYDIKNLKYDYKINSDKLSSSSSSSSSFDKKLKIDIDYTEIKELSDNKINKYLCSMGYKYDDIKDLSKHEKKQLFNKKNNDKIIRLFNK